MTKFLLFSLIVAVPALADMRFTLNCTPSKSVAKVPNHIARYKLVKIAFPKAKPGNGPKWDSRYAVAVYFKSQPTKAYEYPLVPAGSGDEDYSEWDLKAEDRQKKTINVNGAYIQNQFRWGTLVDTDGMGFADCR